MPMEIYRLCNRHRFNNTYQNWLNVQNRYPVYLWKIDHCCLAIYSNLISFISSQLASLTGFESTMKQPLTCWCKWSPSYQSQRQLCLLVLMHISLSRSSQFLRIGPALHQNGLATNLYVLLCSHSSEASNSGKTSLILQPGSLTCQSAFLTHYHMSSSLGLVYTRGFFNS